MLLPHTINAAPLKVNVVLSEEGGTYQEYTDALRNILINENVILSVTLFNQTAPDADLHIAVGMKAATLLAPVKPVAILNVFISKEGYNKLQRDAPQRANPFSAIYLDQPIERQLDLIAAALPNASNIGMLYAHPPSDLATLRKKISERNLVLHEQAVILPNSLPTALQGILRSSEVILAQPDVDVYNTATIRNILLAAYRAQVPIIGFSSSFVRAGGLCAVFSTPAQIATQTGTVIKHYAELRTLPEAQFTHEFEVLVNLQVARSLGLNIPISSKLKSKIGISP